jgi:hypothetical protein
VAERLEGALAKTDNPKHLDFIEYVDELAPGQVTGDEVDPAEALNIQSIITVFTLYNEYRTLPRYKAIAERVKAETVTKAKALAAPTTPEEAQAQIERIQKDAERAAAAEAKRNEALKRAQEFLAKAQGTSEGDEFATTEDVVEEDSTDEDEAF